MPVKHAYHSARDDSGDSGAIQPSHFNEDHVLDGMLLTLDAIAPTADAVLALDAGGNAYQKPLAEFAPSLDAVLQGSPTTPTPPLGDASLRIANMEAVQAAIDALLGGAPGALDTLQELAAAINDDASFAATVTAALAARLYVDAPQGLTVGQQAQGRDNLGLGTTATLDAGTAANNVVQLDGTAKLPAVDGSNLTNVIAAGSAQLSANNTLTGDNTFSGTNTFSGVTVVSNTTDATDATNGGAMTVAGGFAVVKKFFVGLAATIGGVLKVTDATEATGAGTTASAIFSGGVEILKRLYVTGNAYFTGQISAASGAISGMDNSKFIMGSSGLGATLNVTCHLSYTGGATSSGMSLRSNTATNSTALAFVNSAGTSVGSVSHSTTTTTYNTTSDKTLKTDPRLVADPTRVIMNTEVWDFEWIETGARSVGVFAQDAYEICPDAITPPTQDGDLWTADYSKYVPYLIAHNQHLQRELDEIKKALKLN